MTPDQLDPLEKKRRRRDALNAQIRQELARREKRQGREDTRIKVLIGAVVKYQAERDPELMGWLRERFFTFYPEPEKHADKHELFNRLVKPVENKPAPAADATPQA
jgi:hypothetical protein